MADAVSTVVMSDTGLRYDVILTNVCDGTGETLVKKIDLTDISSINDPDIHPKSLALEKVEASVNGFDSVSLFWDRDPSNLTMVVLPQGNTEMCLHQYLNDPKHGQTGTGDILLTTNAAGGLSAQESYTIHLRFKCKY